MEVLKMQPLSLKWPYFVHLHISDFVKTGAQTGNSFLLSYFRHAAQRLFGVIAL